MKLFLSSLLLIFNLSMQCSPRKSQGLEQLSTHIDSVPSTFLPGIVSSDSLDFNAAFSPDGRTCYFTRSKAGKWHIFESIFNGRQWQQPTLAQFSEPQYSQADPFVTPDGKIYYISNRPKGSQDTIPDFDIWVVRPISEGRFSAPENVPGVNTDSTEYYVSLAPNGNIYFASTRAGGFGGLDIYRSVYYEGRYLTPENLGSAINTSEDEHDPLTIGNEDFIVFAALNRPDGFGEADLYYSSRTNTSWSGAINLGKLYNTSTYEYCPNLSPDGMYFFFSSEYDVKWIKTDKLPFLSIEEH